MLLDHDVLDRQIVDRDGAKVGKVDDLVLELREDKPPIVIGIDTRRGGAARQLGKLAERLDRAFRHFVLGLAVHDEPDLIPWNRVQQIDVVVKTDVNRVAGGFQATEQSVWKRWLRFVPFAQRRST